MGYGMNFPTILLAVDDDQLRAFLLTELKYRGYLVLQAQDGPEAVEIVRLHSRPIQLMLTAESVDARALAATLKKYRPDMRVLFVARYVDKEAPNSLTAGTALAAVLQLLNPPRSREQNL
jgi:CheY-like chemotaxis protein